LGAVSSPGQPVRQLCNLLVDQRIQDLQIPREIPADAICKLRYAIIDRPGYKASPSGDLEPPYGAQHVESACDQHPGLIGTWVGEWQA
jgi:hypothetical protein